MNDLRLVYQQISKLIGQSNYLLLISSPPDGDSVGSTLAFSRYLKSLDKRHRIFCKNSVPPALKFLPGSREISANPTIFKEKRFDGWVVFDSGDLKYAGVEDYLKTLAFPRPAIINFDHHAYNQMFGDINAVNSRASSTTQVLFDYFKENRVQIDKDMAASLLTGILTDTGCFFNPATTFESLAIAAELLKSGVRFNKVANETLKNKSISSLKLWGEALTRLRLNRRLGIATTVITQEDLRRHAISDEAVEGIANFLNNLDDVKAVLVLREMANGKIKGSLRTSQPDIDLSLLAAAMGGGGHKKAAGFTVDLNLIKDQDYWLVD